ncbi:MULTISPECIES: OmpA family protein [unclassified Brenneria]|uniref:OmpA family protein n=1 Tax=unclassified Brenneria TaxID=2634434 RepID=UPI0015529AF8|nr:MULTISPECIES: OmpA family protein [unclassified Brenneria]MBJ7221294.1 OmpA family protein [Brenneria sp. L3-3C-1]MEE3642538.1 OmpA family protein [Brenneria sp. L3_3C_1]MEE3650090.1 OmpA family protein [Brenneria sp. HEZEL_4_2_4]NPD00049.1 OmpA family protein [Brenneria sp. hezel4-2-4]
MKTGFISTLAIITAFGITGCQSPPNKKFTPEQISALQSQGFKNTATGWTLGFPEAILFANNKSTLTAKSKASIHHIAAALCSVGLLHARMDGHADSTGESSYNLALSLRRANTVADAYAKSGNIPRSHLTTRGFGDKYPVASNNHAKGRAENRRVAIIITAPR